MMIQTVEFYSGMSVEMKNLGCSEMCVKTDDMIELITRLRQAEKDAARYRWLRNKASREDIQDFSFSFTSERDAFIDEAMNVGNN
ncbi:MAG: hypothetical protein ACRCYB_13305 [Aeromonas veronii]